MLPRARSLPPSAALLIFAPRPPLSCRSRSRRSCPRSCRACRPRTRRPALPGQRRQAASATSCRRAPAGATTRRELAAFLATGATVPALLRPARHVPRPRVRDAGAEGRATSRKYFKDSSFGVARGRRRADLLPARRRHDRARPAASACRTSTARRATARCSALGYAAAEDRLFFMDVLRHAGRGELSSFAGGSNAGDGRRAVGGRALHRGRPRPPGDAAAEVPRRRRRADPARRRQLHRRHQPVHRRGQARPDQAAGRVRGDRAPRGPASRGRRPT